MEPHVGERRLGHAQERDLDRGRDGPGVAVDVQGRAYAGLRAQPLEEPPDRGGQRRLLQRGRREGGDDAAGLLEVVDGGGLDLREQGFARGGVGRSGAGQQHDRAQALGKGVVDVAGDAGALGGDPGLALGGGELVVHGHQVVLGGDELLDEAPAVLALSEHPQVGGTRPDRDQRPEHRPEHHAGAQRLRTGPAQLRDDHHHRHRGGQRVGDQGRQHQDADQDEREGQPGELGRHHQHDHGPEPHEDAHPHQRRGAPSASLRLAGSASARRRRGCGSPGQAGADGIPAEQDHRGEGDEGGRGPEDQAAHRGHGQQHHDQTVQRPLEAPHGRRVRVRGHGLEASRRGHHSRSPAAARTAGTTSVRTSSVSISTPSPTMSPS